MTETFGPCQLMFEGTPDKVGGMRAQVSVNRRAAWFEHCFAQAPERIELRPPQASPEAAKVVQFDVIKRPVFCKLSDWVLAKFPMRVARLSGDERELRGEAATYDWLFAQLASHEVDAVWLEYVRPESVLWRYLKGSRVLQKFFRPYSEHGPVPHWLVRFQGSFSDYLKEFSPKTRKNRLRELKILRGLGDVKLIRVTQASEIESFLKAAYEISEKTWQFKRFGWSIAAREAPLVRNEMMRLAETGCLRCYLLTCDNVPCAFILGEQTDSTFLPVTAGIDPAWKDYSVGTALLLLALEDLFKENSPEFYDLGTSAKRKNYLANDSYLEADVWLFRKRAYPTMASSVFRICNLVSRSAGTALERAGLKHLVTRIMRSERVGRKNPIAAKPAKVAPTPLGDLTCH
jgi:hypothetical protein